MGGPSPQDHELLELRQTSAGSVAPHPWGISWVTPNVVDSNEIWSVLNSNGIWTLMNFNKQSLDSLDSIWFFRFYLVQVLNKDIDRIFRMMGQYFFWCLSMSSHIDSTKASMSSSKHWNGRSLCGACCSYPNLHSIVPFGQWKNLNPQKSLPPGKIFWGSIPLGCTSEWIKHDKTQGIWG